MAVLFPPGYLLLHVKPAIVSEEKNNQGDSISNNKQLKKDLTNAKARLKAASKKLEKLESSGDNQAIAEAQSKVDLEQEIIDDLQKRLLSETDNVTAIVRKDDGSLEEIVETKTNPAAKSEELVIEDAKSLKEVIN